MGRWARVVRRVEPGAGLVRCLLFDMSSSSCLADVVWRQALGYSSSLDQGPERILSCTRKLRNFSALLLCWFVVFRAQFAGGSGFPRSLARPTLRGHRSDGYSSQLRRSFPYFPRIGRIAAVPRGVLGSMWTTTGRGWSKLWRGSRAADGDCLLRSARSVLLRTVVSLSAQIGTKRHDMRWHTCTHRAEVRTLQNDATTSEPRVMPSVRQVRTSRDKLLFP